MGNGVWGPRPGKVFKTALALVVPGGGFDRGLFWTPVGGIPKKGRGSTGTDGGEAPKKKRAWGPRPRGVTP